MGNQPITPEPLFKMATGYWATQTLHVATGLGLFTMLRGIAKNREEISEILGIDPRSAAALLNACVALGLLCRDGALYSNTPMSAKFLTRGQPAYFGDFILMLGTRMYQNWGKLDQAVRTGKPVESFLDLVRHDPQYTQEFARALFNNGVGTASNLAKEVDFSNCRFLLDLGGGSGVYSIMLAKSNPELRARVFDFPIVCEVARDFVQRLGVSSQVSVTEGDFLEDELPSDVDAVLLSNVLHDIGTVDAGRLLGKIHRVLPPHGQLVIVEYLLDDDQGGPVFSALFGLTMLIETANGKVFSEHELRELLSEAGFGEVEKRELPGPSTALVCRMSG